LCFSNVRSIIGSDTVLLTYEIDTNSKTNSVHNHFLRFFRTELTRLVVCVTIYIFTYIYGGKKLEKKRKKFVMQHVLNVLFVSLFKRCDHACWSAGFPSNTHKQKTWGHGFPDFRNQFHNPHSTSHHQTNSHRPEGDKKEEEEKEFCSKRIKLNTFRAEVFGAAFGAAWNTPN
jgi:hypothetical protein